MKSSSIPPRLSSADVKNLRHLLSGGWDGLKSKGPFAYLSVQPHVEMVLKKMNLKSTYFKEECPDNWRGRLVKLEEQGNSEEILFDVPEPDTRVQEVREKGRPPEELGFVITSNYHEIHPDFLHNHLIKKEENPNEASLVSALHGIYVYGAARNYWEKRNFFEAEKMEERIKKCFKTAGDALSAVEKEVRVKENKRGRNLGGGGGEVDTSVTAGIQIGKRSG